MKVLHINAGLEKGGGLFHVVNFLTQAKKEHADFELLTLAEGPVSKMAKKRGIKTTVLGTQSRYNLTGLGKLVKFINEGNFDIVHTHGPRANLYLSLIRKKIRAKWVITVHSDPRKDFEDRGLIGKAFTNLNLKTLQQADGIFAITQNFATILNQEVGIDKTKICVLYNGIFFHDNSKIARKFAHPYFNIINVGRQEPLKGQDVLLKAIKKLGNANVRVHLVGDGSKENYLKALTKELGISQQVIFHGFLTQKETKALYRKMNLAVLTSYSESFPLVLLEASDNLVPILSTDVGDIKKMIPNENYGFVAPIGDIAAISEQLDHAINTDPVALKEMAKKEKQYLSQTFSMRNQYLVITNYYRYLLKKNRSDQNGN